MRACAWRRGGVHQAGIKFLPDQNGVFEDGHFPVTISNADERRVSAAIGYLDRATRARTNLTVSTDTMVRGLLFDGAVCTGVRAAVGRKTGRVSRAGGDPVQRRDSQPGAPAPGRDRAGRRSARSGDRGARQSGRRWRAVDGSSVDRACVVHQARCADGYARHAAAHPGGDALFVGPAGDAGGGYVRRVPQPVGVACGGRADRVVRAVRQQDVFRGRTGATGVARSGRGAGGGVQSAVRQPRHGAADGRVPSFGRNSAERADAGGDDRSVSRLLQRPGAADRGGEHEEPYRDPGDREDAGRSGGPAELAARSLCDRGIPLRRGDARRRQAGGVHPGGGDRRVARLVFLPDGRGG